MRAAKLTHQQGATLYIPSTHIGQKYNMSSTQSDIPVFHLGVWPCIEDTTTLAELCIAGFASKAERDNCTTKYEQDRLDEEARDQANEVFKAIRQSPTPTGPQSTTLVGHRESKK